MRIARHGSGFTLLEMLVVIAIMGLIAGLGFPAVDRSIKAQAFRTASAQIELAVRQAQADAIRQQRTVSVARFARHDPRGDIALARAPFATDLRIDQSMDIRFFRDGTSTGGTIQIGSGGRKVRIQIDPVTGIMTLGTT